MVYLNNILIYTKKKGEEYMKAIQWLLDQLWKYPLCANLKKCQFYKNEMRLLGYIVSY